MDQRKCHTVTVKFQKSAEKAKAKGFIINWANPKRHIDDDLLRYIFRVKLGINIPMTEYPIPITIEELAFCLDEAGILDK